MVKNKARIVQYLIETGFVEQSMTKDVWLKQYETIDCCVSLGSPTLMIEWYPHGDYSRKCEDLSTQPELLALQDVIKNIVKTNHMPSIFGTSSTPPDQATESPGDVQPPMDDSADLTNQPGPTPPEADQTATLDPASSSGGDGPQVGKSTLPQPSFMKLPGSTPIPTTQPTPQGPKSPETSASDVPAVLAIPPVPGSTEPPAPDAGAISQIPPVPKDFKPNRADSKDIPSNTPAPVGGVPALSDKKSTAGKSHDELDRMMNDEKAKRWLESRGKSYKVHGNERPDAASIQRISNLRGGCTQVISAVQTNEYAEAIVRVHIGLVYAESVVHHNFENYRRLLILERVKKNPDILDGWNGELPVLKPRAQIKNASGNFEDAMYTIMHSYFSFIQFALRDAVTKASASAQAKVLNQDFQEEEDLASEQFEVDLIKGR